jgi:poly-D-alanine transfer protein DltD
MKKLTDYLISDLKQKRYLKELTDSMFIDMDDYFKRSGQIESNENILYMTPKYRRKQIEKIYNDMSKYKLKNYYEPRK